ncbi:MAG: pyridoxine 5'-phosphate synthase [Pseudomonadales bacterium]
MAVKLSVNLNKVALLRNSRDTHLPSVTQAAVTAIEQGADGITVHPRPDQRHIRPDDVFALAELLAAPQYQNIEFNIEGNPYAGAEVNGYPGYMELVQSVQPDQATLVPDDPAQLTSDHGWDLTQAPDRLAGAIETLKVAAECRVSCFMDPVPEQLTLAKQLGTDRIEFYTGPYADAYGTAEGDKVLAKFTTAAKHAADLGLGINAGHDLNQDNLASFCQAIPQLAEVSIGHAIISEALWLGLGETVKRYRTILDQRSTP